MLFASSTFIIFFIIFFLSYWSVPKRFQNWVLVAGNMVFYAWWDVRFVLLLSAVVFITYKAALLIKAHTSPKVRRHLLIGCLLINIGTLFIFKYFNFFIDNLNFIIGMLDLQSIRHLSIILPIGLSFYTFLLTAYIVDVYKGKVEPADDIIKFFAFASFFPTILAGPIERAGNLLRQLDKPRFFSWAGVQDAAWLICWGLLKKVVMADQLNPLIEPVISNPSAYNGLEIIIMVLAFTFQIYLDFSSYSDIAMGLSKLLGLDILLNFKFPYLSSSPQQFWRSWHISLSKWLRDYLYIPFGGNQKGEYRTYANLMATMLIGGLWHGAAWNFILWGGYHGLLLAAHRFYTIKLKEKMRIPAWISVVFMFAFISYGWMLFKAESFEQISCFTSQIFLGASITLRSLMWAQDLLWTILPLIIIEAWQYYKSELMLNKIVYWWAQPVIYGIFFYLYFTIGLTAKTQEFIYFQF